MIEYLSEIAKDRWLFVGLFGQLLFASRFLAQWIYSERAKASVIPMVFWYLSLAGGVILLSYAIHIKEPVFILGQSMGAFIYMRNIHFRLKQDRQTA